MKTTTKKQRPTMFVFFLVSDLAVGQRLLITTWAHNAESIRKLPLDQLLATKSFGATVTDKVLYSDDTIGHRIQFDNMDYLYLHGNKRISYHGQEVLEIALIRDTADFDA
jgi:hypothetical protein